MGRQQGVRFVLVLKRDREGQWYRKTGGREPFWVKTTWADIIAENKDWLKKQKETNFS